MGVAPVRSLLLASSGLALGGLILLSCASSSSRSASAASGTPRSGSATAGSSGGGGGASGWTAAGALSGANGAASGTLVAVPGADGGSSGTTGISETPPADGGAGGVADGGPATASSADSATAPGIDGGVRLDGGALIDGTFFYMALDDGTLHMYEQGTWEEVATWTGLPVTDGVRGSDFDPSTGILYLTHGGAGAEPGHGAPMANGGLLAWSLVTNKVIYNAEFNHGVDQPAYGLGVVYVPAGEFSGTNVWYYVSAADGSQIGTETGGLDAHDSIFRNGHRYYGGVADPYLYVQGLPITKVGPSPNLMNPGVRPFTVNAAETRVYITWTDFRGYSVGDLTTGNILSTQNFGVPCEPYAPSHGITLSPDGSEIYVMDVCMNQVRVYDSSDQQNLKDTITLAHSIYPGNQQMCAWDCAKDGWLLHSRDGKYVYVADSGDVIATATRQPSGYIPTLANGRHGFLEVTWSNGVPIGTTTHVGLGY
jgi:hypothetical protein